KKGMIFYQCKTSDNSYGNCIICNFKFLPEILAFFVHILSEPAQVEAERYDVCFFRRTNFKTVADFFFLQPADGNDGCTLACKITFHFNKETCFQWTE